MDIKTCNKCGAILYIMNGSEYSDKPKHSECTKPMLTHITD